MDDPSLHAVIHGDELELAAEESTHVVPIHRH